MKRSESEEKILQQWYPPGGFAYFAKRMSDGAIKIGASLSPRRRMIELERIHGPMVLLGLIPGYYDTEKDLHSRLSPYRIEGEWFYDYPEVTEMSESYGFRP